MIQKAIVHGRFQPPHNGHIRYILEALSRTDHLTIGICTPDICTEEYSKQTGYPCTKELNPYTHTQRSEMISITLDNENISKDRYSIVPFPSDYKDVKKLISKDTVFFISHTSTNDSTKKDFIESLGYNCEIIMQVKNNRNESGQKIRDSIANKDDTWKTLVPKAVVEYLD